MKNNNTVSVAVGHAYSGPIPEADELIKYNQAIPNAADRILSLAEHEAQHRHEMQVKEQADRIKVIIASMISAVICVIVLGCVIVYAIHEKESSAAIAASISAIAAVAGIFFWYRKNNT